MMKTINILIFVLITGLSYSQIKLKEYSNDKLGLKETTLSNGMKVFLIENHDKPEIYGSIVVNVGSKDDPSDNTGMAHYLEHMLFKGTQKMGTLDYEKERVHLDSITILYDELKKEEDPTKILNFHKKITEQSKLASQYSIPNECDKILAEIGDIDVNAYTSRDRTVYHGTFPPNQIEKWLEVSIHRLEEPVFRLFQLELEAVYEESNFYSSSPYANLYDTFFAGIFKGSSYGEKIIGKTEHLKKPSLSVMYAYFKKYYVPNNMALILTGDFNSEEILPMLSKKLLRLPKSNLIKQETYSIDSLEGKDEKIINITPNKEISYGYRTKGLKELDIAKLDLLQSLLSNDNQTGSIDQLYLNNKVINSVAYTSVFRDYGVIAIDVTPKLRKQSFSDVDELVESEILKIKKGEFSIEKLEVLKNNLKKSRELYTESNEDVAYLLTDYYIGGANWNDVINYNNRLDAFTKKDVIDFANEVFGTNYFVVYSNKGKNNVEKLKKPPFKWIPESKSSQSNYYSKIQKIKEKKTEIDYIDFTSDINKFDLKGGVILITTKNPRNNLFKLSYRWDIGSFSKSKLETLELYLNLVGANNLSVNDLKSKFESFNAKYLYYSDERYFYLNVDGDDKYLDSTVNLTNKMIQSIENNNSVLNVIKESLKSKVNYLKSEPDEISNAIEEFSIYRNESLFLNTVSLKENKKVRAEDYLELFNQVQNYQLSINYIGNNNAINDLFEKDFRKTDLEKEKIKDTKFIDRIPAAVDNNIIYFINNKYTAQSKIKFFIDMGKVPFEEHYKMKAFNEYFGVGMGSLVYQEIRERRALAYRASGMCRNRISIKNNEMFYGFIGCQNDKTIEALEVYCGLIKNLPKKPERIDMIKGAIIQRGISSRPGFRNISSQIEKWQESGYNKDPNYLIRNDINELTFNEIIEFYETYIKDKPITISIVGDKKQIDFEKLATFGTIKELKIKDIYVD